MRAKLTETYFLQQMYKKRTQLAAKTKETEHRQMSKNNPVIEMKKS